VQRGRSGVTLRFVRPLTPLLRRVLALVLVAAVAGSTQVATASEYEAQVIGGRVVTSEPWQSTVYISTDAFACTGSLIAPTWVLTAAHCIDDEADIYGGAVDPRQATWRGSAEGIAHPGYEDEGFTHDVGLYRLDEPHPASLPEIEVAEVDDTDLWRVGDPVEVYGWGIDESGRPSSVLRTASLDVWPARNCEQVTPDEFDESAMLCLFRRSVSTCSGDSGGPVVRDRGGRRVLVGVTSWGPESCDWFAVAAGGVGLSWVHRTAFGSSPPATRLQGVNRYETAAAISKAGWSSSDVVYVTTGRNFPDALSAGPAAAAAGAPLLLVDPASVPAATAAELTRLRPRTVFVIGGEAAVSTATLDRLRTVTGAAVTRVAGRTRYETANATLLDAFPTGVDHLHVATGRGFADAMIAGAAAAVGGGGLLLVDGTTGLDAGTLAAVEALAPSRITLVGSIAPTVRTALQDLATVGTLAGSDVTTRSAALWDDVRAGVGSVVLATSSDYADGLAGAPYAALSGSPLLVVPPSCVPSAVDAAVTRMAPGRLVVLGGSAALSDGVAHLAAC
jgi:putative cell wall-binding protein/V8-like Glu-specific endopeptidase